MELLKEIKSKCPTFQRVVEILYVEQLPYTKNWNSMYSFVVRDTSHNNTFKVRSKPNSYSYDCLIEGQKIILQYKKNKIGTFSAIDWEHAYNDEGYRSKDSIIY